MPGVDIRKNDNVMVISGKDRGRKGRVLHVLPREGRVMVEGVARVKRHLPIRPAQRGAQQGGIILKELFVDISNVQVVCRHCDRPSRVGHRVNSDGVKVRVCRRCGGEI
jgi:large subunit ribosomal protein L24